MSDDVLAVYTYYMTHFYNSLPISNFRIINTSLLHSRPKPLLGHFYMCDSVGPLEFWPNLPKSKKCGIFLRELREEKQNSSLPMTLLLL